MTFFHSGQLGVTFLGLVLLSSGCRDSVPSNSEETSAPPEMFTPAPKGEVLSAGKLLPPLMVEGWLNGPPFLPPESKVRLVVVDVWAQWCPYCRMSAPELVRVFHKYGARGVSFVSLTSMPRDMVEAFVKEFALPWPNGYGAHPATVAALGVTSGMMMAEYQIAPTVYLVGPDGRVRWCDSQGRVRHTAPQEWGKQLDDAIDAALETSSTKKP